MKCHMAAKKNDVDKYLSIQKYVSIYFIYIQTYKDICINRSIYIILLCEKSELKIMCLLSSIKIHLPICGYTEKVWCYKCQQFFISGLLDKDCFDFFFFQAQCEA